jgi:hypothetical protein
MSRFWSHLIKIQPRFDGTDEEAMINVDSHHWTRLEFDQLPEIPSKKYPSMIVCKTCDALADSNAAEWPCGEAPPPVTLEELARRKPTAK